MLTQQTLEKMNAMKLSAMAEAFEQQLGSGEHAKLSFEERLGLLVDCRVDRPRAAQARPAGCARPSCATVGIARGRRLQAPSRPRPPAGEPPRALGRCDL